MRCVPSAATWAKQQRLLLFLRDGYFGRLIYQWSRWCTDDELITCREFLLLFTTVTTCPGLVSTSVFWYFITPTCFQALLRTVPVTVGLRGRLPEMVLIWCRVYIIHLSIPVCVRVPWNTRRGRDQLEVVSLLLPLEWTLGQPAWWEQHLLLRHLTTHP